MPNKKPKRSNPYCGINTALEGQMEDAVREREASLPPVAEHTNGEHNGDDRDFWVAYLEEKIFRLDDEMESLKTRCGNVFFCIEKKEKLFHFEENLAMYIYPRGRMFGKTEIFPNLMNWLDDQRARGTARGDVAHTRWLQVQHEFPWSRHHEDVLTKLRNLLPVPTIESAGTWNPVSLTEVEQRCIAGLTLLSERLTVWIENEENERENLEAS